MTIRKQATIRDVAKMAGVAVSTASRALGNGPASKATREKGRYCCFCGWWFVVEALNR